MVQDPSFKSKLGDQYRYYLGRQESDRIAEASDGSMFQELLFDSQGQPLLALGDHCIGLCISGDFWTACKSRTASLGAVWFEILNFLLVDRKLIKNIGVLQIVPDSSQKLDTLELLEPLGRDLADCWRGVLIDGEVYRIFLYQSVNDRAALVDFIGVASHGTQCACWVCKAKFAENPEGKGRKVGAVPHRGYNYYMDPAHPADLRTQSEWQAAATKYRKCKSKNAQREFVHQTGIRFSPLTASPYGLDVPRRVSVEPMHAVNLGAEKVRYLKIP